MRLDNYYVTKGYGIILDGIMAELCFNEKNHDYCIDNEIDIEHERGIIMQLIDTCLTLISEQDKNNFLKEYNDLKDLSSVNDFNILFDTLGNAISDNDKRWTYYYSICGPAGLENQEGRFLGVKVSDVSADDLMGMIIQGKKLSLESPSASQREMVDNLFGFLDPREMLVAPDCICCT